MQRLAANKFMAKKDNSLPWSVRQVKDIHEITIEGKARKNWEQWVLLSSDRHWDNPKSNRNLQKRHLQLAKERKAIIVDNGDLFCLMQGRYDPRGNKSAIRPEHNVANYLDKVIDTAADYFAPYGDNFTVCAIGNHEASVSMRCETDITGRFVKAIKERCPTSPIRKGGITGFVRFAFKVGSERYSYLLDYHHGYGGGGPVTKGVIQASRRAVYSDADIVIQGHTHEAWEFPIQRRRVTKNGKITHPVQWHLQIPSYKAHYEGGKANWENLKGFPPKPLGCVWLRFFYAPRSPDGQTNSTRVQFERHLDLSEFGA